MRRMPEKEIAQRLGSVLRTFPEFSAKRPADLCSLNDRLTVITAALASCVDNDFAMVIHTDHGKWGVDEPDPAGPARWHEGYCGGAHDGSSGRGRFSGE